MRPVRYLLQPLLDLFRRLRALTMLEMKAALGTEVDATVFRKLATLPYRTSYSQRGAYYTLDSLARFDAQGLWCCRGAWFSRHGTLLDTAAVLVHQAPAGYWIAELEAVLHIPVKDALRQLVQAGRLHREDFGGHYLYTAAERRRRQEQWPPGRRKRFRRIAQKMNSGRHGSCSTACSTNSNAGSMRGWRARKWVMAGTT